MFGADRKKTGASLRMSTVYNQAGVDHETFKDNFQILYKKRAKIDVF